MTKDEQHQLEKLLADVAGLEVRHSHDWDISTKSQETMAVWRLPANERGEFLPWLLLTGAN